MVSMVDMVWKTCLLYYSSIPSLFGFFHMLNECFNYCFLPDPIPFQCWPKMGAFDGIDGGYVSGYTGHFPQTVIAGCLQESVYGTHVD